MSRDLRHRALRASLWALALLSVFAGALNAQTGTASQTTYSHLSPTARAVRATGPIQVDGNLDEALWSAGEPITGFIQIDPLEGEPVSERTEVRIAYDDNAIYVAAVLYDRFPLSTRLARRDANVNDSDFFEVHLDSYHDHQTAYRFAVNPSGMKRDAVLSGGGGPGGPGGGGPGGPGGGGGDSSWDPVWDVATQTTPEGWRVEMRIPFSQLRFSPASSQVWGVQFERLIERTQERAVFSFTPQTERGGVPRYGHLEGLRDIPSARRLEILPYLAARAEYQEIPLGAGLSFENPYRTGSDLFRTSGLDLKYGITSNITLDATANPDFGQVDADPAEINLTAFETQQEERRPFFVEGADIFRFGEGGPMGSFGRGPQLLYSRRIGRAPQVGVPTGAAYSDSPDFATILGAAKLTGKTAGGWSIGLLEAVTQEESARYIDATGARAGAVVEPLTNYFVGRLRRDINDNMTRFGVIATSVNRRLDDPRMADRLRESAYSGGVDIAHEWANRSWKIAATVNPSYVTGSPEAIRRTQVSSARYFNRPDADYLEVDPSRTSLFGYYAMADLNKQAGRYLMKVAVAGASPGYEPNDLGFQTTADRIVLDTNFAIVETRPGTLLRRWELRGGPDAVWNYGGDMVSSEINLFGNATFANYWGFGGRLAFNPETTNDRLTRGGPLSRDPRGYSGNFNISSDSRKAYNGRLMFQWAFDEGDSWSRNGNVNVTYRPLPNWQLSLGTGLNRSYTSAQYITAVADPLAARTFGSRYVFAGIDQTTVALQARVNVTFTPTLSLEMYAEPFLSSGDYRGLKELRAPGEFAFVEYGIDTGTIAQRDNGGYTIDPDGSGGAAAFSLSNNDFNYRSLLGNSVLRWEWRAGSTLFLVWQQSRDRRLTGMDIDLLTEEAGNFDFNRDVRELFDVQPANIFMIKLNYWLNP